MDHDLGVRQAETLAGSAGGQENGGHGGGHTDADGGNVGLDVVHRVQDSQTGIDLATGRIDVEGDILLGILALEVQKLRDDQVGSHRVDLLAQKDDAVVQETGVDVIAALTARGLLDDVGHERGVDAIDHMAPFGLCAAYATRGKFGMCGRCAPAR